VGKTSILAFNLRGGKSQMGSKNVFAYHFYRRERNGEDQYLCTLTEKRRKPERITHFSIMNWARFNARKDVLEDRVYFLPVQI